jgi:hypothetical protein
MPYIGWIKHVKQTTPCVEIYLTPPTPPMLGTLGQSLYVYGTPEDQCTLKVVVQLGTIGVQAEAFNNIPGLPQRTSTDFIPAVFKDP